MGAGASRILPQRIPVTSNFYLDELVDPYTYFSDYDHGRGRLDDDAVNCVQLMRDLYGKPITINNWWDAYVEMYMDSFHVLEIIERIENSDSMRKWSGFRTEHCPIGAKRSAHKFGKAFDIRGDQNDYFDIIEANTRKFYKTGLKRIENPKITNGWLHLDTIERNHKVGFIRVINLRTHAFDIEVRA